MREVDRLVAVVTDVLDSCTAFNSAWEFEHDADAIYLYQQLRVALGDLVRPTRVWPEPHPHVPLGDRPPCPRCGERMDPIHAGSGQYLWGHGCPP